MIDQRTPEEYQRRYKEIHEFLKTLWKTPIEKQAERLMEEISKQGLELSSTPLRHNSYPGNGWSCMLLIPTVLTSDLRQNNLYLVWKQNTKLSYQTKEEYVVRVTQALENADENIREWSSDLRRALWIAGLVIENTRGEGNEYPEGTAWIAPDPRGEGPERWPVSSYINWRRFSPELIAKRRIGCAAVRSKKGRIVSGLRHFSQDMRTSINLRSDRSDFSNAFGKDQGFIDNYGTYLDRIDAYQVAKLAGQLLSTESGHTGHRLDPPELFSEMIY